MKGDELARSIGSGEEGSEVSISPEGSRALKISSNPSFGTSNMATSTGSSENSRAERQSSTSIGPIFPSPSFSNFFSARERKFVSSP